MGDDTKVVMVSEELRHKMEVAELRSGKAQSDFVAAQRGLQLAQLALEQSNKDVAGINERIAVEITDRGAWDLIHQNMETGEFTLKISAVGKQRRTEAAEAEKTKQADEAAKIEAARIIEEAKVRYPKGVEHPKTVPAVLPDNIASGDVVMEAVAET